MEKRRVDDLIAYLDRLITLDANEYRTTREIMCCLTEIQRELRIGPWDRAYTIDVAEGFSEMITGPASVIVLPRGDRG